MEKLKYIITLASSVLPLVIAMLTFIIKFIRTAKMKKSLEKTLQLTQTLQTFIVDAEKFINYNGEEKKEYVMTRANQFAIEHSMKFDGDSISALIDRIVNVTKQVNARPQDTASSAENRLYSASI